MEQSVLAWIAHYGYLAIFTLLMFGIAGLPVPDETLITFSGYLAYKGHFSLPILFVAAWAGSACGITISFYLGRIFGMGLIHRYGKYVHLTEGHIQKAHAWFDRVGHWGLTFGYFIPGVRHVSALAAGMSAVTLGQFATFAYSGACLWVSCFLSLGFPGRALVDSRRRVPPLCAHHYHRWRGDLGDVSGLAKVVSALRIQRREAK
jgi:membrane protein DedA with SNARE-associated domain